VNLFLTADKVGTPTGGGLVTAHEKHALEGMGECATWDRDFLAAGGDPPPNWNGKYVEWIGKDPWLWDMQAIFRLCTEQLKPKLCHIYSGTWPETVSHLKAIGCRTTITCAAHDKDVSRDEHKRLGVDFDKMLPHLVEPQLWERYSRCYRECDVLICPSERAKEICVRYGCTNRIEVIPHGVGFPPDDAVLPLPAKFVVGYMGSCGSPDKGVTYLLEAWRKLNYKDAVLVLAGRDSTSPYVQHLVQHFGGGSNVLRGWVDDVSDFYNSIALYVQPSATEGFGLEVVEAMAYGRAVVCSDGAGAADLVLAGRRCPARNAAALANAIDDVKRMGPRIWQQDGQVNRERAAGYTWPKIREQYQRVWRSIL
jgi:glycosyltransferase involved in cell wall biosynthesis